MINAGKLPHLCTILTNKPHITTHRRLVIRGATGGAWYFVRTKKEQNHRSALSPCADKGTRTPTPLGIRS